MSTILERLDLHWLSKRNVSIIRLWEIEVTIFYPSNDGSDRIRLSLGPTEEASDPGMLDSFTSTRPLLRVQDKTLTDEVKE